jgi:glycolate oxidase FAD binding subunit
VSDHVTLSWPEPPAGGPLGDGRHAIAALRPQSIENLCQAVREHVGQGHAIYPQGGTTSLDYGGIPRRPGVAIDIRSLCRVIDYPHADMTITVQAGITVSALRSVLAGKNQRLLIDVPREEEATLGGVFATNTSGLRRYGVGRPRDQIIGVSFVTSEGVEVKGGGRVVKNVAGYDFPKLLTGSLGTLGIITQMTLKVRPLPEASAILWVPFFKVESLDGTLDGLNTSGARPVALELLNRPAAKMIGEPLDLPANDWVLVIGLEDNVASVRWQIDRLMIELGRADLTIRQDADSAGVWSALTEFQASQIGPVSCVANVRPSTVVGFVEQLDPALWTIQAHAGNGIVHMHARADWSEEETALEIERLRGLALRDDGNLILARCPTEWKGRLRVWGEPRPDWALAERVKQALDPKGAMNPGRFVGCI